MRRLLLSCSLTFLACQSDVVVETAEDSGLTYSQRGREARKLPPCSAQLAEPTGDLLHWKLPHVGGTTAVPWTVRPGPAHSDTVVHWLLNGGQLLLQSDSLHEKEVAVVGARVAAPYRPDPNYIVEEICRLVGMTQPSHMGILLYPRPATGDTLFTIEGDVFLRPGVIVGVFASAPSRDHLLRLMSLLNMLVLAAPGSHASTDNRLPNTALQQTARY